MHEEGELAPYQLCVDVSFVWTYFVEDHVDKKFNEIYHFVGIHFENH